MQYNCEYCGKKFKPPRFYYPYMQGFFCNKECSEAHVMEDKVILNKDLL
jgi:hypothetical protein